MQNLATLIRDLNQMVLDGNAMEAFEKYYDIDVIMQENEQQPTIGKEANRQREIEFFNNIVEFRGAAALYVAVGDGVTMVVWHYDYTHMEWGARNYTQVSVQHWKNGKIIKEQFFYGN
ncbi:ester cyclase [Flavihumibacter rivuli]|uniref:ester cyclase n=1 Tax=Flavihumibacter rivuli TaxID=2838156 RepID=UPI001BDF327C|nr:ester cyclase [Flavihumibacter rivuli]ULQ55660.1 ester cyclase [Flavihumibacter rivuli]